MIVEASRAPERVHRSRASNSRGYVGLLYERSAIKMLKTLFPRTIKIEHGPWFYYTTVEGFKSACQPDVLIHDDDLGFTIVVEIKNTWVPTALPKLRSLYCPVVAKALSRNTRPVVLVRHLTPEAPKPFSTLYSCLDAKDPLIQWLGRGAIQL